MPTGLDGHPDPIRTPQRTEVLDAVADLVCARPGGRTLVGVDGRSGAGKSTFADELASTLTDRGVATVRSTTDSFHRPRADRMQRGPTSASGYYLDSHQVDRIVIDLIEPFTSGESRVLVAAFDEPSDSPAEQRVDVGPDAVLVFDGLFLQRPELAGQWDVSVFLEADERRDSEWLRFLLADLPHGSSDQAAELDRRLERARWPRYRRGWQRYVEETDPVQRASLVIDNNDLAHPRIITGA